MAVTLVCDCAVLLCGCVVCVLCVMLLCVRSVVAVCCCCVCGVCRGLMCVVVTVGVCCWCFVVLGSCSLFCVNCLFVVEVSRCLYLCCVLLV